MNLGVQGPDIKKLPSRHLLLLATVILCQVAYSKYTNDKPFELGPEDTIAAWPRRTLMPMPALTITAVLTRHGATKKRSTAGAEAENDVFLF